MVRERERKRKRKKEKKVFKKTQEEGWLNEAETLIKNGRDVERKVEPVEIITFHNEGLWVLWCERIDNYLNSFKIITRINAGIDCSALTCDCEFRQ